MFDGSRAREFINTLANDMAACMLADSTIEAYEQEIIKNIANTFVYLIEKDRADSILFQALGNAI